MSQASIALPVTARNWQLQALPPLALYVHIPWCLKKCPYCDFNSHAVRGDSAAPEHAYVEALLRDLEHSLPLIWGRPVYSVFIGGGTPSLFSAAAIEQLITGLRTRLPLAMDAEITLEANPGTFEVDKFRGFREAGVNRLSIGVQSFNDTHLSSLGRVHAAADAHAAAALAAEVFPSFNLDLMYGLPGQTLDQALADLDAALAHQPSHLSCYHLTLEPNTLFHRYPPALPDDDLVADMQLAIEQRVAAQGYANYEVSAFARPGFSCWHNRNYWLFGDYLGIGAGAHSKLSFPERILRQQRHKQPQQYLARVAAGDAVQEQHSVSLPDLPLEFMMNALRLRDGFAPALFTERTGLPLRHLEPGLSQAESRGWLYITPQQVAPTQTGLRYLNELLQLFMAEDPLT